MKRDFPKPVENRRRPAMRAGHRVVCALLFVLVFSTPGWAVLQSAGNVTSTTVGSDVVDFTLQGGPVARVELLAADLVRVRFNPTGALTTRLSSAIARSGLVAPGAAIFDTPGATFLATSQMTVVVVKAPFRVVLFRPDGSLLLADMQDSVVWDSTTGLILARKYSPLDEHYFGLGERGGPIDRRGRALFMKNVDWFDYGEFTDPLYISIPFYYGVRDAKAYGVFLDNPAFPVFDMDLQRTGVVTFGALEGELDYYVMAGPEPWQVAQAYARLTGATPLPPKWSLGFHQSRYGYTSQDQLLFLAWEFRQRKIPCDVLYLDIDYLDQLHLFTWDPVHFPSPINMNALLGANGFKRVNILEPLVRNDDPLWPFLAGSRFFLADGNGVPVVNSIWYGDVSWVDFTKDPAREWYKSTLKTFLSMGISGTWNDLNEPAQNFMPQAVYDFNGERRTDQQARNLYALHEASLTYAAQKELRPNVRPWSISRSGYSGIQRYTANWSGDAPSSFESLRVALQLSLSMGLSGQNLFGHDIGGFLGAPSPELFIRWMEFASFTPLFRNHAMNTSPPREPWSFGEPYTSLARNVINERYRLLPYLYTVFEDGSRTGRPALAPLFFQFPADAQTYSQDTEFLLGPSLLVAPVIQPGASARTVYLPVGSNWLDYYTDTLYPGGQSVMASAPLGKIPVFVREGAIVPRGPVLQYVEEPLAPSLTVEVYPGPDSTFLLYEDDGKSFDYLAGIYLRTQLARATQSAGTLFTIARSAGSWMPPARSWTLQFHGVPVAPAAVELNGFALLQVANESDLDAMASGWFYRSGDHRVLVRLQDSAAPKQIFLRK